MDPNTPARPFEACLGIEVLLLESKIDKRKNQTRQRLFEKALELFSEKGFEGASVRDICRAVGITPGGFYNHFDSKESLLEEVYHYYHKLLIAPAGNYNGQSDILLESLGPVEYLKTMNRKFLISMTNPVLKQLSKIIVQEQYRIPQAAEIAFKDRQKVVLAMEELFELMALKAMIKFDDPRNLGRLFGYAFLGIFSDNLYFHYFKKQRPEMIVEKMNCLVEDFMGPFLSFS
ncbi:MAG: TetR/AcrR family transcriptional regulator [Spirochaetales bacterium]|nr:TetR/AcrR family transcriptional regulator [Spirochaetales bacterium]